MFVLQLFAIAFFLSLTQNVYAEILEQLDTVIVSATRSEQSVVNTAGAISVITASDIKKSGASNVTQVLRNAAGIQISDLFGDGSNTQINLRGFGETAQQNTLVLIDGRRLNNTDNGAPDLNSISISDIERIEIVKGSASTLYGDKAIGGVINIITRTPTALRMHVQASAGTFDRRSIIANVSNRLDNGVGFRLNAEKRDTDNYRDNNELDYSNLFGKLDYQHQSGLVFLEYQTLEQDLQTPGALFRDQVIADREQAQNPDDFFNTHTWVARIGVEQDFLKHFNFLAEYTNRRTDSNSVVSTFGTPGFSSLKRNYREWTPRVTGTIPVSNGNILLTMGYDFLNTDYSLLSSVGITLDEQVQQGLYARVVIPLSHKLDLTVGGRHGRVDNTIFASTVFLGVALPVGSEIDDTANAGEVGLSYRLNNQTRLFARAEHFFRFVTADEYSGIANFNAGLFPAPPIPFPVPLADTQTGESLEAGVQWQGNGLSIDTLIYQIDTNDEIVFEPITGINMNIGDSRRRGAIVEVDYNVNDNWRLKGNYSYIDTEITSGVYEGAEITFIADHVASVSSHYAFFEHYSANLQVQGISSRVFGGDFSNTFPRLPGRIISNLNLSYQPDHLNISLTVNNLLDKEYSDGGNIGFDFRDPFFPQVETFFPAPERSIFLTIGYTYE